MPATADQLAAAAARMNSAKTQSEFEAAGRAYDALLADYSAAQAEPIAQAEPNDPRLAPTATPGPMGVAFDQTSLGQPANIPDRALPIQRDNNASLGFQPPAPSAGPADEEQMAPGMGGVRAGQSEEFLAGRRPGGRGGLGGGAVAAQSARAGRAGAEAEAAHRAQLARMESVARNAEEQGVSDAIRMATTEEEYASQQAEYAGRMQAAQGEYQKKVKAYEAHAAAFQKESAAEVGKASPLHGFGAALALALGGFGARRNGGQNVALNVINSRIQEEAKKRADRLEAGKMQMDALDRLVWRAYQDTQSVEAARAAAERVLFNKASLEAERYAKLSASQDKADQLRMVQDQLAVGAADAQAAYEANTLAQVRKAAAGPSRMQRLKEEAQALENVDKANKINGGGSGGEFEDKYFANQAKRMDDIQVAKSELTQLRDMAVKLKKEGFTEFPGMETAVDSPLEKGAQFLAQTTGLRRGRRGPTGFTPEQQRLAVGAHIAGKAMHLAKSGQVSNTESESADAARDGIGNGNLDGFIDNMNMHIRSLEAQTNAVSQQHDTPFRRAMKERLGTPANVAPRTQSAVAPVIPGARRRGG